METGKNVQYNCKKSLISMLIVLFITVLFWTFASHILWMILIFFAHIHWLFLKIFVAYTLCCWQKDTWLADSLIFAPKYNILWLLPKIYSLNTCLTHSLVVAKQPFHLCTLYFLFVAKKNTCLKHTLVVAKNIYQHII